MAKAKYGTQAYHKERIEFYEKMDKKIQAHNQRLKKRLMKKLR